MIDDPPKDSLNKIIKDWVYQNGGAKVLADIIISENHEIYTHEAVKADIRLKARNIFTNDDIKPIRNLKGKEYTYNAIVYMYYNYTYEQMASQLNKSVEYIRHALSLLIKQGRLVRIRHPYPRWTQEEDDFIIKNGYKLNTNELAKILGRTSFAVANRKKLFDVRLEDKYKKAVGRCSHKINRIDEKEKINVTSGIRHLQTQPWENRGAG